MYAGPARRSGAREVERIVQGLGLGQAIWPLDGALSMPTISTRWRSRPGSSPGVRVVARAPDSIDEEGQQVNRNAIIAGLATVVIALAPVAAWAETEAAVTVTITKVGANYVASLPAVKLNPVGRNPDIVTFSNQTGEAVKVVNTGFTGTTSKKFLDNALAIGGTKDYSFQCPNFEGTWTFQIQKDPGGVPAVTMTVTVNCPGTGEGSEATVPGLETPGFILLTLLMGAVGVIALRRRGVDSAA
jgi:hypothetical protein